MTFQSPQSVGKTEFCRIDQVCKLSFVVPTLLIPLFYIGSARALEDRYVTELSMNSKTCNNQKQVAIRRNFPQQAVEKITEIVSRSEQLEAKGKLIEGIEKYKEAPKLLLALEGECGINYARSIMVLGGKQYRALMYGNAEENLLDGVNILQSASIDNETCSAHVQSISLLNSIYFKRNTPELISSAFFGSWPSLNRCIEIGSDTFRKQLFNVFLDLSHALFMGYGNGKQEENRVRAENAFDVLNKANQLIKPAADSRELADLLYKGSYYQYIMIGSNKLGKQSINQKILKEAESSTQKALEIYNKIGDEKMINKAKLQLAYIYDLDERQSEARKIYVDLINDLKKRPFLADNEHLSDGYSLLTGYLALLKGWSGKWQERQEVEKALVDVRLWEYLAMKRILPFVNQKDRLDYFNAFSASERLGYKAHASKAIGDRSYLDTFLQLRYLLIDAELEAQRRRIEPASDSQKVNSLDVASFGSSTENINHSDKIRNALGERSVFIQYVAPHSLEEHSSDAIRVFVVSNRKDSSVFSVQICRQGSCEKEVDNAYKATAENLDDAKQLWDAVLPKILPKMLVEDLKGYRHIYIGLDGGLQKIPIAFFRNYLANLGLQNARVSLVQSIDDLSPVSRNLGANKNSLVFYSPHFGSRKKCKSLTGCLTDWGTLPFADFEGKKIASLLKAGSLTGNAATKQALMSVVNPGILHVATHAGYGAGPSINNAKPELSFTRGVDRILDGLYDVYVVTANANELSPELTILNFKDISTLRLNDTSLVVISGCQSGLGGVKRGYGLFGLHRTLVSAGAQSTLLSLWKVDDEASLVFMKSFYTKVMQGLSLDVALAETQNKFVREKEYLNKGWNHPYYWAGWQLSGSLESLYTRQE